MGHPSNIPSETAIEAARARFAAAHPIPPRNIMRSLVADASYATGIPTAAIRGPLRHKDLCRVRFAVMRAGQACGLSLNQIGRGLSGRDHTTVLHGLRRADEMQAADPDFRALVEDLLT